jgi:hypothetical protein
MGVAGAFGVDVPNVMPDEVPNAETAVPENNFSSEFREFDERRLERSRIAELLSERWTSIAGLKLSDAATKPLELLLIKFSISEILDAMETSAAYYLRYSENGEPTAESADTALRKIGGICYHERLSQDDPTLAEIHKIRNTFCRQVGRDVDRGEVLRHLRPSKTKLFRGTPRRNRTRLTFKTVDHDQGRWAALPPARVDSQHAAHAVVSRGWIDGEVHLTIDWENKTFYFGRTRDGYGTTYSLMDPQLQDELASVIKKRFEYIE